MAVQKQGKGSCCLIWTETTRDTALGSSVFTADSGVELDSLAQGVPQTRAQTPQATGDKVFPRKPLSPTGLGGRGDPCVRYSFPGSSLEDMESGVTPCTAQSPGEDSGP